MFYLQERFPTPEAEAEAAHLLTPDVSAFRANLHVYVPALTRLLAAKLDRMKTLAMPIVRETMTTPSRQRTKGQEILQSLELSLASKSPITSLPDHLSSRLATLHANQTTHLPALQRTLISSMGTYLAASTASLERSIRLLSRNKHSTAARAQKARAEALSMHAICVSKQAAICKAEAVAKIYDAESIKALKTYQLHLQSLLTQEFGDFGHGQS